MNGITTELNKMNGIVFCEKRNNRITATRPPTGVRLPSFGSVPAVQYAPYNPFAPRTRPKDFRYQEKPQHMRGSGSGWSFFLESDVQRGIVG